MFNTTKKILANQLLSPNVEDVKLKLQETKVDYLNLLKLTRNKLNQLYKFIAEGYQSVLRLRIPILNFHNIYSLQSVNRTTYLGETDTFLEQAVQNISVDMEVAISNILDYISDLMKKDLLAVEGMQLLTHFFSFKWHFIIVWQRFCEPARLRIAYCLSVSASVVPWFRVLSATSCLQACNQ